MRFYEIAFFILLLNLMTVVVNSIPMFPTGSISEHSGNPTILTNINNFTTSFTLPKMDSSISGFTAFIWLPWMAINALNSLYQIILQVTLGFPILIGSFFGCSSYMFPLISGCYPPGIEVFIYTINGMVLLIYVIAIIQFIRGQNVEKY